MGISPKSAKAKGRELQNWLAARLAALLGMSWGREDEDDIQPRQMGQRGADILLRGEAARRLPFAFECKSGESFRLVESIKQARDNETRDRSWVIVHRRKAFRNPIVMMDWSTFEDLLRRADGTRIDNRRNDRDPQKGADAILVYRDRNHSHRADTTVGDLA